MSASPPERTSHRLRSARVARRPSRLGGTVMAFGIIFALAYVFVLRAPPPVPTPRLQAIGGTYELVRSSAADKPARSPRPVASGTFAAWASGDAAGTLQPSVVPTQGDQPRSLRSTYDAWLRLTVTTSTFLGREITTRTVGTWPPGWQVATPSPLDYQGLAAVVRSAVEDKDRTVGIKPLEEAGRKVWRAALTFPDDDLVEVVVDQQTGLVLWHSETERGGTETFTTAPQWGATASPRPAAPPTSQTAGDALRGGQKSSDGVGAYAPSLDAAGQAAGYTPLASDLAPDGFTLKAVATLDTGGAPANWLTEVPTKLPTDPFAGQRDVVQWYTRGLSWFTMQQLGPTTARKSIAYLRDALRTSAADKLSFETTTLQYGAFAGRTASTWYERSGPTLLVSDARDVVYVTGALTRQELIAFAEGLTPASSGGSASPSPSP